MAGNDKLIETISDQAFKDLQKYIDMLEVGIDKTIKWEKSMQSIKLPSQSKGPKELPKIFKEATQAQNSYLKGVKQLQRLEERRMQSMTSMGRTMAKQRVETSKLNRENRIQAQLQSALVGQYSRLDAALNKVANQYRDLAVKKELGIELTKKEERRMARLGDLVLRYDKVLKKVDAQMGRNQRNVGNYKSGFDSLGFSVAQISREMPAFANSMQTGFMAISNNIPMLVDEINKLRAANKALEAEGRPTVSVMKSLGSAVFGWQTVLSIGITLLTVYGAKLADWAFGMSEAEKAAEAATDKIKEQNDAIRENLKLRRGDVASFEQFIKSTVGKFEQAMKGAFQDEGLLMEAADRLQEMGVAGADALRNENIEINERALLAKNLLDIERINIELAETRLKISDRQAKIEEIEAEFLEGKINLKTKESRIRALEFTSTQKLTDLQNDKLKLERQNQIIIENIVEIKAKKNKEDKEEQSLLEGTIAYYEAIITELETLRNTTALNTSQYKKFSEEIEKHKKLIADLKGEYERLHQEMAKTGKETEKLIKITVSEEDKEAISRRLKEIGFLEDAFTSLGATLGIQPQSIKTLFDQVRNGFTDIEGIATSAAMIIGDSFNSLAAAENQRIEERIESLNRQKEIEIAFAGDSAEAKAAVEARYQEKVSELKRKQAENEKEAGIINSIINTAAAVVKALPNIPLSIAVGALGAAQTAIIASQPIPQFKTGVRDFAGGLAIVGDGGKSEPITDRSGRLLGVSPDTPTLVSLPKGANVYKDYEDFDRELNGLLGLNSINPFGGASFEGVPVRAGGKGTNAGAIAQAIGSALSGRPTNIVSMDKNGFSTYIQGQYGRAEVLNNRTTFKGMDV